MTKFKNKYRIEPARLKNWDYAESAAYFVTICTANTIPFFGMVQNNSIVHSEIGKIVASEWVKSPAIRPDMNLVNPFPFLVNMPNRLLS